jgi:hypothetical protein
MIQNIASVDVTSKVNLRHLDVVMDSTHQIADTLNGADALIMATGFVPSNPLKMSQAAHAVDNVSTCHLIDTAKQTGIKHCHGIIHINEWSELGTRKESRVCSSNECIWECIG